MKVKNIAVAGLAAYSVLATLAYIGANENRKEAECDFDDNSWKLGYFHGKADGYLEGYIDGEFRNDYDICLKR